LGAAAGGSNLSIGPEPNTPADGLDELFARASHPRAAAAARKVLQEFPAPLLGRARQLPLYVWLLDHGETVASAAVLEEHARGRHWLGGTVGLRDCAGLTLPAASGVLVIAPWYRPVVLRHEIGHALCALLEPKQRRRIERCYALARARGSLLVPLAGRSVGEYAACGFASLTRPHARRRLAEIDRGLLAVLDELWTTPHVGASPWRRSLADRLDRITRRVLRAFARTSTRGSTAACYHTPAW
jgi:hypothetical protein